MSPSESRDAAIDEMLSYADCSRPNKDVGLGTAASASFSRELAAASESEYAASTEESICSWTGLGVPEI